MSADVVAEWRRAGHSAVHASALAGDSFFTADAHVDTCDMLHRARTCDCHGLAPDSAPAPSPSPFSPPALTYMPGGGWQVAGGRWQARTAVYRDFVTNYSSHAYTLDVLRGV